MPLPVGPRSPLCHPHILEELCGFDWLFHLSKLQIPYQQNGDDKNTYDMRLCELYQKQGTLITWHRIGSST